MNDDDRLEQTRQPSRSRSKLGMTGNQLLQYSTKIILLNSIRLFFER